MTQTKKVVLPAAMMGPEVHQIFDRLEAGGGTVRFVGGCIRDLLLGRAIADITDYDLATDVPPNRVIELLEGKVRKVVPIGFEHGTITAMCHTKSFHITTLREDILTNGRHATVRFTEDWAKDAQRRDFTINALSVNREGTLYDYVGGLSDLREGRIKFVGTPTKRIKEDYLRILRFFRFYALYGKTVVDRTTLDACRASVSKVSELSGERIWHELELILKAHKLDPTFRLMSDIGLLKSLLPADCSIDHLFALARTEATLSVPADAIRRLVALARIETREVADLTHRLKMSNAKARRIKKLCSLRGTSQPNMDNRVLSPTMYRLGEKTCRDTILLDWADWKVRAPKEPNHLQESWQRTWDCAAVWVRPQFLLKGKDILECGLEQGPRIGEILSAVEQWWVNQEFRPDRKSCLERVHALLDC